MIMTKSVAQSLRKKVSAVKPFAAIATKIPEKKPVSRPKKPGSRPTKKSQSKIYLEDQSCLPKGWEPNDEVLAGLGMVESRAYFFTREGLAAKKSRDAEKAEARRAKNDDEGVGQVNTEAPRALHVAIKAFAAACRSGGSIRDAILALICALPVQEMLYPADLRNLEVALAEHQKGNGNEQ